MRRSTRRAAVPLSTMLLLAACATGPEVSLDPASNPFEARRLLVEAAAEGPVLVTWRGAAPLAGPDILRAVERGVRGLALRTTATGETERRLVLDFSGGAEPLCDDSAAAGSDFRLGLVKAAFCDGGRVVALAGADPEGDPERLIWRLIGRLVPDDYPDTYGFGVFGNRITFGLGAGF